MFECEWCKSEVNPVKEIIGTLLLYFLVILW